MDRRENQQLLSYLEHYITQSESPTRVTCVKCDCDRPELHLHLVMNGKPVTVELVTNGRSSSDLYNLLKGVGWAPMTSNRNVEILTNEYQKFSDMRNNTQNVMQEFFLSEFPMPGNANIYVPSLNSLPLSYRDVSCGCHYPYYPKKPFKMPARKNDRCLCPSHHDCRKRRSAKSGHRKPAEESLVWKFCCKLWEFLKKFWAFCCCKFF